MSFNDSNDLFKLQPPPSHNSGTNRTARGRRVRQTSQPGVLEGTIYTSPQDVFTKNSLQLFNSLNPKDGVLSAATLVPLFRQSNLSTTALGEIWHLSDKNNKGFLNEEEFGVSLKLIAIAQTGAKPSLAAVKEAGPELFPKFEPTNAPAQHSNNEPLSSQPPPPVSTSIWSIPAEKKEYYAAMFFDLDPEDEFLDGLKARDSFMKSDIPVEKLSQIWTLVDSQERGKLTLAEFLVAMHLIELVKSNAISALPAKVPLELIKSASDACSDVVPTDLMVDIPEQSQPDIDSVTWEVTPQQIQQIQTVFEGFPKTEAGDILAKDCVIYFTNSGLSKEALAQIWELASFRDVGSLDINEFSVAMLLIQKTLNGMPIPPQLPEPLKSRFSGAAQEEVIPEPLFTLDSLNVEEVTIQPDLVPSASFDHLRDEYSLETKTQLNNQLMELKATLESDRITTKELELLYPKEKMDIDIKVAQVQELMKSNQRTIREQKKISSDIDKLTDDYEEMQAQCQAMEEEDVQLKQASDKLVKDSRIELGFLEYNIEGAHNAHKELNDLLIQLGEQPTPLPDFLTPVSN